MPPQSPLVETDNASVQGDPVVSVLINAVKDSLPSDTSSQAYDRGKLKEAAYKLALALETPGDTVNRVAYYVSSSNAFAA